MGLGDLLNSKKNTNPVVPKKPVTPVEKKMSVRDVKIASRSLYDTKIKFRELQGAKVMSLKKVKLNGEFLDKQKLATLYHTMAQKNRRDLTFGDFEKRIKDSYRNNIKMSWIDKNKLLTMIKDLAEKELPKERKAEAVKEKLRTLKGGDTEQGKVNIPEKFVSPKNQGVTSESSFSRLGLSSANTGLETRHAANPSGFGMNQGVSVKPDLNKGLVKGGNPSVIGGFPRGLSTGGMNQGGRPRIGGL